MRLPSTRCRQAARPKLGDPCLDAHGVDPIEAGCPEGGQDVDTQKRLVALERSRFEVRSCRQPLSSEIGERCCRQFGIDPLSTLHLRFDMDEELLGVDLAPEGLGSFAACGIYVAGLPLGSVDGMAANVGHSSTFLGDEIGEPALDITPAEAQVLADPEPSRAGFAMSPRVDRLHRDFKIHGKLLSRQETLGTAYRL